MARISVEQLYQFYGAALRAKVQLVEFQSWGPSTTDSMKKAVADYDALEASFVQQMLEDRRRATEVFKAQSGL